LAANSSLERRAALSSTRVMRELVADDRTIDASTVSSATWSPAATCSAATVPSRAR